MRYQISRPGIYEDADGNPVGIPDTGGMMCYGLSADGETRPYSTAMGTSHEGPRIVGIHKDDQWLEIYDDHELIEELMRRHRTLIIGTVDEAGAYRHDSQSRSEAELIGLCEMLQVDIKHKALTGEN